MLTIGVCAAATIYELLILMRKSWTYQGFHHYKGETNMPVHNDSGGVYSTEETTPLLNGDHRQKTAPKTYQSHARGE